MARARTKSRDDWLCLGLDLSLSDTGVAVLRARDEAVVHLESIKTTPSDGGRIERDDFIADRVGEIAATYGPHLIIIEEYAFGRATQVSTLGELGGLVKRELWRATGVSECWVTAASTSVKLFATGSGKASKDDMIEAANPFLQGYSEMLYIRGHGMPASYWNNHNVADAVHLARFGISRYGEAVRASVS
jgi:Holliday junction resolvasome RuvABC endonuclease subunit